MYNHLEINTRKERVSLFSFGEEDYQLDEPPARYNVDLFNQYLRTAGNPKTDRSHDVRPEYCTLQPEDNLRTRNRGNLDIHVLSLVLKLRLTRTYHRGGRWQCASPVQICCTMNPSDLQAIYGVRIDSEVKDV